MNLLFDQGNSRVRWALCDAAGRLVEQGVVGVGDQRDADLSELNRRHPSVTAIVVSSVAGEEGKAQLAAALRTWWSVEPAFAMSRIAEGGITCGYADPASLGVDRWLAMLGARTLADGALLVVDAGTAMTIDAVDEAGLHLGGYIVPGYSLQCRALDRGTARVRLPQAGPAAGWGRDTGAGVANGVLLGLAALIDRSMIELQQGVGDTCRLVLTGGDAPLIAPMLLSPAIVDEALVFRGMAVQLAAAPNRAST